MHLKHIPMDGPQNFRDLGGFLTASGQAVAWNRLYRADGLADLSARDEALLQRLGVGTVVDLRSRSEQAAQPDRLPAGVALRACPMMAETPGTGAGSAFARSLRVGYLEMIGQDAALVGAAARAVMEGLQHGAVVFHCTAGKDRTGVLAAVLLLRLGVSEADITADYQVSHTYNENGLNRRIAARPELRGLLETAGEDTPLHSHPKNIRAVLEILNTGNIAGWLEAAGVPAGLQADFCSRMLEPIR